MSDPQRSPQILECRWGLVRIDGHGRVKDAKLFPGGARAWDWGETGTRHRPGIQPSDVAELVEHGASTIVLSRGVLRMLGVCSETLRRLGDQGVAVQVLPTPEAVDVSATTPDGLAWFSNVEQPADGGSVVRLILPSPELAVIVQMHSNEPVDAAFVQKMAEVYFGKIATAV